MMLKKLRFLLLVLLIPIIALTSCATTPDPSSPEGILNASNQAMANIESYAAKMDMKMSMKMDQSSVVNMDMLSDIKYIAKPKILMSMDSNINFSMMGQEQTMQTMNYIEQTDSGLTVYTNMQDQWMKNEVPMEDLSNYLQQDPAAVLDLYNKNLVSAEILGEESVAGKDCYKINVVISSEALTQIMEQFGGAESMGLNTEEFAQDKEALAAAGDLSTILWIDKNDSFLVKQSLDLSEFMTNIMKTVSEQEGETADFGDISTVMTVEYLDYNAVEAFTIPDEARNAS
ncbi:MAG: DUF6612 family protein [Bacillota bacterium]|jgi:hypothetical protein